MDIGVDIDGVLTDYYKWNVKKGKKFLKLRGIVKPFNPSGYEFQTIFPSDYEEERQFWLWAVVDMLRNCKVRKGARKYLTKLIQDGNQIIIVTARHEKDGYGVYTNEYIQQETVKWLKRNKIPYHKLSMGILDKRTYCVEHNIDILIDDSYSNIVEVEKDVPCLLMSSPHSEGKPLSSNTTRVNSWKEVYKFLKEWNQ